MPDRPARPVDSAAQIALGMLPGLVGYQVRLAQIAIYRDLAAVLGDHEMTPGLFAVLVIVDANPGLKQTELAAATQIDRSTVVSVIDNLERRGLVDRHSGAADRRSNALRLTAAGQALLRTLERQVAEHEQRVARWLTSEERDTLVRLLARILPDLR